MKRKVTLYKPERKSHTYFCVGYEGHECGLPIILKSRPKGDKLHRCPSCTQMHKKIYAHDYYVANMDKAKEYQVEYNRKFKKAQRTAAARNMTSSCSRKLGSREQQRSMYHPSDLMHSAPESFEKAVNRILSGKAVLAGVK